MLVHSCSVSLGHNMGGKMSPPGSTPMDTVQKADAVKWVHTCEVTYKFVPDDAPHPDNEVLGTDRRDVVVRPESVHGVTPRK